MDSEYDDSDLCRRADDKIKTRWIAQRSRFPSPINRITTALHMNDLAQGYFEEGMLAYVKVFRDKKFAKELPVKLNKEGSNLGDDHKTFFAGDSFGKKHK
jgi:isocitrate lyase